jgi:hypothetical protein
MTFSLRLTADLILALAARAIGARRDHPLILQLSIDDVLDSAFASQTACGQETANGFSQPLAARLSQNRSPIIWITGSEPLEHPHVARFTNAIAASGRQIFLETSGASLKPRLHEFQPSSRFYFAIRLDGRNPSGDLRGARPAEMRTGLEALRMARLAGFFTCARLVLRPDMASGELEELHAEVCKLDVDGFMITYAPLFPGLATETGRLRRRLLNRRWALLSSLLDVVAPPAALRSCPERERSPLPESQRDSLGEGAEAG